MSVDEAGRGKGLLDQDGERRTIVVKNGDTIRPLFGRSQAHKDLNNEVRELFKETVLKVCDAQTLDDLPEGHALPEGRVAHRAPAGGHVGSAASGPGARASWRMPQTRARIRAGVGRRFDVISRGAFSGPA